MKKVIKIDKNGCFIEDVILQDSETTPNDCIDVNCSDGFYKPKWNGTQWIEGLSQIEIDSIKNRSQTPTTEERLASVESAITALIGL